MTSKFKNAGRLFFCLGVFLLIKTPAQALDKRFSFALSRYILAKTYEGLGDIDTAIEEYKKALKADYKSSTIHLGLASNYIKKNQIPKAIEELNLSAKFDPEAVEPHAILSLLYSAGNQPALAEAEYEIALINASKLQPQNIDIYKGLGAIYTQQRKFKEAQNVYNLILDLSPNDAEAHFYLGHIYYESKNKEKALMELKKAIELKPDYHEALNYLGYLYVEENRNLVQAEGMIKKALELDPDNGAYIDSLGWLHFKKGKVKEAIKELERASSLLEDPVIYEHLGDAYFKIEDIQNAKVNWEKSLKLDPNQDKVKEKLERLNKLNAIHRSQN